MKINELLNKRPTLSFEIFPPKNNENDITSIYATIDELANLIQILFLLHMEQMVLHLKIHVRLRQPLKINMVLNL